MCKEGYEYIVKVLIKYGVKINIIDMFCYIFFYYVCINGYENVVRLLLNSNVNINLSGCNKWYFLYRVC